MEVRDIFRFSSTKNQRISDYAKMFYYFGKVVLTFHLLNNAVFVKCDVLHDN
jgi:hypothetical protein